MGNLVEFVLVDNGGTNDVKVTPSGFANGIAEWTSANSRSQAYRVTASLRQSSKNIRKYTVKIEVPKVATQTVGGVELPVAAWRSYLSMDISIPVYATKDDMGLVLKSLQGAFKTGNPIGGAIALGVGFY